MFQGYSSSAQSIVFCNNQGYRFCQKIPLPITYCEKDRRLNTERLDSVNVLVFQNIKMSTFSLLLRMENVWMPPR